ncbi:hypothetical protein LCL97_21740 [Seohaeicola saemankumensis]|nr:hypothetical protein [Seohaeicola saemankumensis]MCA0873462.1 hypothetical protein [Seohaeicola saemankumensis]
MSRALAAQPDTVLLSEITPVVGAYGFNRFDPVQQFLAGPLRDDPERFLDPDRTPYDLSLEVFADRLRWLLAQTSEAGCRLVLRDHAHSDFIELNRGRSGLRDVIRRAQIPVRSIVTLRHPMDSYYPARQRGWTKMLTGGFDEYCQRLTGMLEIFDAPVFLYEDFCLRPGEVTEQMCAALNLPFDPGFQVRLKDIGLTGNSGRKADEIAPRPRLHIPRGLIKEARESEAYQALEARFWPGDTLLEQKN